ncbi:MAG: Fe-S cluster assembly protein SufD [Alphaproteobacteria bacterium]|nr:Fe-S cluster assembly protein SufD [Alphaproteobacteria bacterium]
MSAVGPTPEPAWLTSTREAARARFAEVGLPSTRLESWRWSSTRRLADVDFEPATGHAADGVEAFIEDSRIGEASHEHVFLAGRHLPELARRREVSGLTVLPLREALADDRLRETLGGLAAWQDPADAFTALNLAGLQDGLVVHVARGASGGLVHLVHVAEGATGPTSAHVRLLVVAEATAELTVAETWLGHGGQTLTTHVAEVWLAPGARVTHAVLGEEPAGSHLVHTLRARLDRDAAYHGHLTWLGGGWVRSDVDLVCAGSGAEAVLDGALVLGGEAHVDSHTRLEHAVPHTASREAYEAVLGGKARGIFDGLVVVQPDAQQTDARQSSRNLLVSADATANAKPTLEIYADDVKCAHGTTVGQLDPDQLGYLRSRGIPRATARQLLTGAFVAERVAHLPSAPLRDRLQARVDGALARLQEDA